MSVDAFAVTAVSLKKGIQTDTYVHSVAVIGSDDRQHVPFEMSEIASGIGLLAEKKGNKSSVCTGFCVAPNIIATNAHCAIRRKLNLSRMRFYLPRVNYVPFRDPYNLSNQTARSSSHLALMSGLKIVDPKQPTLSVFSGSYRGRHNFRNQAQDWAIVKLAYPICKGRELLFENSSIVKLQESSRNNRIFMIGFHGDKKITTRWLSEKCAIYSRNNRRFFPYNQRRMMKKTGVLIPHSCDSFKGASGSPIFMETDDGPKVVGINLGSFGFSKYLVTRNRYTGEIIGRKRLQFRREINMAVQPKLITERIERFQQETILSNLEEFTEVQTILKELKLYKGSIDGLMGAQTRRAIQRFERRVNLPELGIPTQQLLSKLRASLKDANFSAKAEDSVEPVQDEKAQKPVEKKRDSWFDRISR